MLDDWGAQDRTHRDIARWVAAQVGIEPLVWEAQTAYAEPGRSSAATVGVELARHLLVALVMAALAH